MIKIIGYLNKIAKVKFMLIFLSIFVLLGFMVFPLADGYIKSSSGGIGPIDYQFSYSPDRVYSMISAHTEDVRVFYILIQLTLDIIYPIAYGIFFSLFFIIILKRSLADMGITR